MYRFVHDEVRQMYTVYRFEEDDNLEDGSAWYFCSNRPEEVALWPNRSEKVIVGEGDEPPIYTRLPEELVLALVTHAGESVEFIGQHLSNIEDTLTRLASAIEYGNELSLHNNRG